MAVKPNCTAALLRSRFAKHSDAITGEIPPFAHFCCEICFAPVVVGPVSARSGPALCSNCRAGSAPSRPAPSETREALPELVEG